MYRFIYCAVTTIENVENVVENVENVVENVENVFENDFLRLFLISGLMFYFMVVLNPLGKKTK